MKKIKSAWLYYALVFLVIAIVFGLFGFGAIAGMTFTVAKWLFFIFVILFIVALIKHTDRK